MISIALMLIVLFILLAPCALISAVMGIDVEIVIKSLFLTGVILIGTFIVGKSALLESGIVGFFSFLWFGIMSHIPYVLCAVIAICVFLFLIALYRNDVTANIRIFVMIIIEEIIVYNVIKSYITKDIGWTFLILVLSLADLIYSHLLAKYNWGGE